MSHPPIDQQVTFLYTRDLATTARFYDEVIGLEQVLDQGTCLIYRISKDSFLGFCQNDDVPIPPAGIIFILVTNQVDSWYNYLQGQGVAFEKPPAHNEAYNIYHCFLRDPNGYLLEIQQFHDPTWPRPAET
jgi:catechol 2,3-dioxygenase-like lactoylglutathione lyase family enzyme